MDITINTEGSCVLARLSGELNHDAAEPLTEALFDHMSSGAVIVDLSGVTFVDSAGLGALIKLAVRARTAEGRMLLAGPTPFVQGVLEVTRLDGWFDIATDATAARARLAASA